MIKYIDRLGAVALAATEISLDLPDDTLVTNFLYVTVAIDTGGVATVITTPSGWTLVATTSTAGDDLQVATYFRFAVSGDPGTITWVFDQTVDAAATIVVYDGVDLVTTVDDDAAQADSAATNITAPSVAPATEDTMLLAAWATTADSAGITPPIEMDTIHFDIGATVRLVVGEQLLGRDEATGSRVAVADASGEVIGVLVALIEAEPVIEGYQDNYKAKLARQTIPPVFHNKLSSVMGKIVSVIGTIDNDVGGLAPEQDFLPDETP